MKKEEKVMKKALICVIVSLLCIGLFTTVSYSAEKVTKLEFTSFLPSQDKFSQLLEEWCRDVEKRTNGRVKVTYHPGGTLTPMPQTYDSVVNGIADIGFGNFGATFGRFPMMEAVQLPYGLKSSSMSARLAKDFYDKFKPKELQNVKVLFLPVTTPVLIHSKKPIKTLEDLKGAKIRTGAGPEVGMLQSLGAVPVVIPSSDVYDSLSKGVVDGTLSSWIGLETFRWGEVVDYTTLSYRTAVQGGQFVIMNKDKWSSLPPDIQKIIDTMSEEYGVRAGKTWDDMDQNAYKTLAARKHVFITLSKNEEERWYQKILPVYDTYVKEKSAKGLPAAEAVKFCQDWVNKNQK